MKNKKIKNITLHVRAEEMPDRSVEDWIWLFFVTALLTSGLGLFCNALLWQPQPMMPIIWIGLGCSALACFGQRKKLRHFCLPVALALAILFCVIFLRYVGSGLWAQANSFLLFLTGKTGRIYLQYAAAEETHLLFFLVPLQLLCGAVSAWSTANGKQMPLLFLLLPAAACAIGWAEPKIGVGMLALGAVLQRIYVQRSKSHTLSRGGLGLNAVICGLGCAIAVFAAVTLSGSVQTLQQGLLHSWQNAWHESRYDSQSNSMPEGNLNRLGSWQPSEQEALEVTMEQPQKLYLRGYTGAEYTATSWQPLGAKTIQEHADLFYWLQQNGFYTQSMLSAAYQALGQENTQTITVRNCSACKLHYDLPYAADVTALADPMQIGDCGILAQEDTYTASYYAGSIPQWFALQNALTQADETTQAVQQYRVCEQAYSAYAEATYLTIPEQTHQVLADALGTQNGEMTISQIKDAILSYLEENMTYDAEYQTDTQGQDFASYVLQHGHTGYSVHYATLATLMLRYYGVPARYCEGYFLSSDQAQAYDAGEPIYLDETYAHAWTEYYLAGVGWLPFEVTPGYVDDEELEGEGIGGSGRGYASAPPQTQIQQQEDQREENSQTNHAFSGNIARVFLPAVLVFLFAWLLLRRYRLRRKLRQIADASDAQAIALQFGYAAYLMRHAGISEQSGAVQALQYKTIRSYQLEALYSDHTMTVQQRQQTAAFTQAVLQLCKETWRWPKRWYYHWIKCLY